MKRAFLSFISMLKHLWQTIYCTFVKRRTRLYIEDIDHDGVKEVVIDPNGKPDKQENNNIEEE